MSFLRAVRACLVRPEFWVLTGTALPPMNVAWAAALTLIARLRRRPDAPLLARSLNIQITYTLLLGMPIFCGYGLAHWPITHKAFAPGTTSALVAGVGLGLMGALAILSLVFFNTRDFTQSVLGHKRSSVPRLRLFPE